MSDLQPHSKARRVLVVLLFALMLGVGCVAAFFQTFSAFKDYDDEGSLMISVQGFLDGHRLYDEVYAQYGPCYYLYKAAIHRLTGLPVTHDVSRGITCATWLISTLFCAVAVYRLTGSLWLGSAVFLLTFRILSIITNEAGHPQELCALLLSAGVFVASFATSQRRSSIVLMGLSVLAAALVLTKINVGFYYAMALGGATASFAGSEKVRRVTAWGLLVLTAILPACLMHAHLGTSWGQTYAVVATLSCVSAMAVATFRRGEGIISGKQLAAAVGAFLITTLLVLLVMCACGTSPAGFWYGVVRNPLHFSGKFVLPAWMPSLAIAPAVISAAAAIGYCLQVRGSIESFGRLGAVLTIVGGCARALLFAGIIAALAGLIGNVGWIFAFATPWIWLSMAQTSNQPSMFANSFCRYLLALAATFQILQAYPVFGSQMGISTFLTISVGAVCGHDVWRQLRDSGVQLPKPVAWAGALVGVAAILTGWCWILYDGQHDYYALTSLNLPGARFVKVPQSQAAVLRCISSNLHDSCDTFFSMPGLNSFYFWTDRKPPTELNVGFWMELLDDEQQRAIIDQLDRHPQAWLVRCPTLVEFWQQGRPLADTPLVRYLDEHFKPLARVGEYDLYVRSERQAPLVVEAASVQALPPAIASRLSQLKLPPDSSPNVLVQVRLSADAHPPAAIERVMVVDAATGTPIADSGDETSRGISIFDADWRPVKLPATIDWKNSASGSPLLLVPHRAWPAPLDYDYSKVLVGLLDEHDELIALPLATPVKSPR